MSDIKEASRKQKPQKRPGNRLVGVLNWCRHIIRVTQIRGNTASRVKRDAELKVKVSTPFASELTKLEEKSLVNYVYIGRPVKKYQNLYGTKPRIQLGDKFATVADIPVCTSPPTSVPTNGTLLLYNSAQTPNYADDGVEWITEEEGGTWKSINTQAAG